MLNTFYSKEGNNSYKQGNIIKTSADSLKLIALSASLLNLFISLIL
jgi:hypothetical protein